MINYSQLGIFMGFVLIWEVTEIIWQPRIEKTITGKLFFWYGRKQRGRIRIY